MFVGNEESLTHGESVDHGRSKATERARETLGAEDTDEHGEHGHLLGLVRERDNELRERVASLGLLLDAGRDLGRLGHFPLDLIVRQRLDTRLGRVEGVDEPDRLAITRFAMAAAIHSVATCTVKAETSSTCFHVHAMLRLHASCLDEDSRIGENGSKGAGEGRAEGGERFLLGHGCFCVCWVYCWVWGW